MKTLISLAIALAIFAGYFLQSSAEAAYNDCVKAGVQSNETCAFYTGYNPG